MKIEISTGEFIDLPDDQAKTLLRIVSTEEVAGRACRLLYESNCSQPRRETATAEALCRKGLAKRIKKYEPETNENGRVLTVSVYRATDEGYWQGDALRAYFRERV